ncbi:hypothetical protein [Ideonella livida]|uniref:Uncharacterized protein n=1 Tax=Ideonella livida TaxID=2707176 RepID=A0A7C9PFF5_9BURK|nr:hypothetical protein [Ideonella livida]NDY89694.1 hypothetical protein [Ideonella livida]
MLARIMQVDPRGYPISGGDAVVAPITGATLELTANWQSPFEHQGPESKVPSLAAMAQSGTAGTLLSTFFGEDKEGTFMQRIAAEVNESAQQLVGSTGMTKLNATQLFAGSHPAKLNVSLHFRAYSDPESEVQQPVDRLVRWHLAQQLALKGNLASAVDAIKRGEGFIKAFFPSQAPSFVSLHYRGWYASPMVIETVSHPLDGPCDSKGRPVGVVVQVGLATLTSLDAGDWDRIRSGRPIALFNNS